MKPNDSKKIYVLPQRLIDQLEELCGQLQSIYLDIYSNYDVDISGDMHERLRCEPSPLPCDKNLSF